MLDELPVDHDWKQVTARELGYSTQKIRDLHDLLQVTMGMSAQDAALFIISGFSSPE
jgi:hypothetical protein